MAWNVYTLSTITWGDRVKVEPESMTWGRAKNHGESGNASFKLGDPMVAETAGLTDLYPGERAIVADWDGTVVYAGIIWDATYTMDDQTLQLSHGDLWSMLERRLMIRDWSGDLADTKMTFNNLSLETQAVKTLVAQWGAGRFALPLVLPSDKSGTEDRVYYGYDMMTVTEGLGDIMEADGGPDVDFLPRWAGNGTLEWVMRVGDLTHGRAEYDFAADDPQARGLWIKTDASEVATKVYAVGEGTEVDTLIRSSTTETLFYPGLERVESFKNVKKSGELQSLARESLRANNSATRQAGFDVLAGGAHPISSLQPGTTVRWNMRKDPYITEGYREWEIVKIKGSLGEWVTIEFQQKGG
ncbi:hypothetical protein [Arthrobacter sp. VKM Ac-2550]|uniref:hypothetical protein n=1 Tax=Crystallibacter permensis TaxID=1938888 RepID=UPI0022262C24|nr:hypothetical protein [Arthrobacter sp. VKM Ac-2550]MCW2132880.1 hypothetical protein [Arthrobacter sp. VKM Ac-2550]